MVGSLRIRDILPRYGRVAIAATRRPKRPKLPLRQFVRRSAMGLGILWQARFASGEIHESCHGRVAVAATSRPRGRIAVEGVRQPTWAFGQSVRIDHWGWVAIRYPQVRTRCERS